jgi:hypothetical protein
LLQEWKAHTSVGIIAHERFAVKVEGNRHRLVLIRDNRRFNGYDLPLLAFRSIGRIEPKWVSKDGFVFHVQ